MAQLHSTQDGSKYKTGQPFWAGLSCIGATVRTMNRARPSSPTTQRSCTRLSLTSFASAKWWASWA